jgi:hypothetical protein
MKVLKFAYCAVMILFIMWFAVSWFDIVADNYMTNPVHYQWNMFLVMKEWGA